jgi:hypothetical protein
VIHHWRKLYTLEKGFLICNSNCAVIGLVPLAALQKDFGLVRVSNASMSLVLDILGSTAWIFWTVVPFYPWRRGEA